MSTFEHPRFANDQPWHGCTTESLRWKDQDYDLTAGTIALRASTQADSNDHLFFVDLAVRTNDGREIVMERIEGGKLLYNLLEAERDAQANKGGDPVYHVVQAHQRYWRIMPVHGSGAVDTYGREFTSAEDAQETLDAIGLEAYEVVAFLNGKVLRDRSA